MRKTFYFNTGVTIVAPSKGQIRKGGTNQIPFECDDVPDGATFMYACDNPSLKQYGQDVIVREMFNTTIVSKYAYFRLNA
jgi:cytochrome c-type biogenesis protein CcmE